MTFDSNMQAIEQSAIAELYNIYAANKVHRYTTYREDLIFDGNIYRRATMKRTGFSADRELGSSKVTISALLWPPFQSFFAASPLPSTYVEIYRAVTEELTSYAKLFSGTVKRSSVKDRIISAECVQTTRLSAKLPKIVYQSNCNWQVFDCDCSLSSDDWDVNAVVTVSSSALVSATFGLFDDDYFTQGRVFYNGDFRFIVAHSGNTITLQAPFSDLVTGGTVTAYPGCDGLPTTCESKFNNRDRFCGMRLIPSHNPVVWGFT